jgi:hypothetical protein
MSWHVSPAPKQSPLSSQTVSEPPPVEVWQVPWQTSRVQSLPSAIAIQAPAKSPQKHFEPVPALTSSESWQLISLTLWAQVSQWLMSA